MASSPVTPRHHDLLNAVTPSSSIKRTRFSDILTSSPLPSSVPRRSILKNSPSRPQQQQPLLTGSPVNRHKSSQLEAPLQLDGMALLTAIYSCSVDVTNLPPFETIVNIVCSTLLSIDPSKPNTNTLTVYGAFYITLRSRKPSSVSLLLNAKSEQILKLARRDLLYAHVDRRDKLVYKRIALIIRCVDYILFIREIVEKQDIYLVKWFYGNAIQILSNPDSPKVSYHIPQFCILF